MNSKVRKYPDGGTVPPGGGYRDPYYESSAKLAYYKDLLNAKLKAKNPTAFGDYFKGLVDLRRSGKTQDAMKYVQDSPYNEYLSPQEVQKTLGDSYDDYLASLQQVNTYNVQQGMQPLYGNVEGKQEDLKALNYGRRFASLQITPSLAITNETKNKTYNRQYKYNPDLRKVEFTESGDLGLRPSYLRAPEAAPADVAAMKKGGKIVKKYPDGGEVDPITGLPVFQPTGNLAQNNWMTTNNDTPITRSVNDPLNYLPINNEGTPVAQNQPTVPLSQLYDQYTGRFGNQGLRPTGQYVGAQGQTNTIDDVNAQADQLSLDNLENANRRQKTMDDAERISALGMTAINSFFSKNNAAQQDRRNNRSALMQNINAQILNPYLEGTGSQAIMEKGGEIKGVTGADLGIQTLDGGKVKAISVSDHSQPMVEFVGREHKTGGIGLQFGGSLAEVENKEVGWVDDEGSLNIFGKLKLPGTNQTFRKTAKDIATQESKVDRTKSKYLDTLNNADITDPYQQSAISTAKVMFKSLDKQSMQIAEKKEALASYQNLILAMAKSDTDKMTYGGPIPKRPKLEDGGPVDPNDPKSVQEYIDKASGGKSPLKAKDFIEVSQKYGVPLDLMLAQATQESNFGTKGRAVRTKNIFNVGNTDDGKENNQNTWRSGLERYAELMSKEYVGKDGRLSTQDILNRNFTRLQGGRYATDPNYTTNIARIIDQINPENLYSYVNTSNADGTPEVLTTANAGQNPPTSPFTERGRVNTSDVMNYDPVYQPIPGAINPMSTQYGAAYRDPAPFTEKTIIPSGSRTRDFQSPLAVEQIAPELLALATNRREAVPSMSYQPDLQQTFDISYQLGRNTNQSTFNQAAQMATQMGSVEAISQLAAQKYQADQAYNVQEVQGNAQQRLQTYNQNTATLNDAQLKNLAINENQQNKQAQALFNTKAQDIAAIRSISGKVAQNKLENRTYNAYANLFKHYGFDSKGNVTFDPDKVAKRFTAGESQAFGLMAAQQGAQAIMNGDYSRQFTKVKNTDGSTTTTETLGTNKQIQDEYKALQKQGFDDMIIGNILRAKYPETVTNP